MATIVRTESKAWKAVIRKKGFPTTVKTFRTKRDAEDWARRTEDEMVRGVAHLLSAYSLAKLWIVTSKKYPPINVNAPKKQS